MHELALYSHVPATRVSYIRDALAAVTGMQPVPMIEHHQLYKPSRGRPLGGNSNGAPSGNASADLYSLWLVTEICDATDSNDGEVQISDSKPIFRKAQDGSPGRSWTLRFADLPEVNGKRPVTSRMIQGADILEGDALAFVNSLGYGLTAEFIVKGHYFVFHNTLITIFETVLPKTPAKSLDPAKSYILQASVKVANAHEQDTMAKGIEELRTLKSELKGVVDLDIGDRLSLDTRVR